MNALKAFSLILSACAPALLPAADLFVDNQTGDDANDGLSSAIQGEGRGPVRSIAAAMARAKPGDAVNLAPGRVFLEGVKIKSFPATKERPLVVDGHGSSIYGMKPLDEAKWLSLGGGLYKNETLFNELRRNPEFAMFGSGEGLLYRVAFSFDGQLQRMGRSCKGPCAPFKKPEELLPGEWTFDAASSSYFIKIAGESLAAAKIEGHAVLNGVSVSGEGNSNIIVRNLLVRRVLNDGFNIHDSSKALRFENIGAAECGDDGVSAHEACEFEVDGFSSYANMTGVCNVGSSVCRLSRLRLERDVAHGLYSMEAASFEVFDSYVEASSSGRALTVSSLQKKGLFSSMALERCFLAGNAGQGIQALSNASCRLALKDCVLLGINLSVAGDAVIERSLFLGGKNSSVEFMRSAKLAARGNFYAVSRLRFGGVNYAPGSFNACPEASGQDSDSEFPGALPDSELAAVVAGNAANTQFAGRLKAFQSLMGSLPSSLAPRR